MQNATFDRIATHLWSKPRLGAAVLWTIGSALVGGCGGQAPKALPKPALPPGFEADVCGVCVIDPATPEEVRNQAFGTAPPGTSFAFFVRCTDEKLQVVRLDAAASTVESFGDDRGTDLLRGASSAKDPYLRWRSDFGPVPKRLELDPRLIVVQVSSEGAPAADARTVSLAGMVVLDVAPPAKLHRLENAPLVVGPIANSDGLKASITHVGTPLLVSNPKPLAVMLQLDDMEPTRYKGLDVLGADGQGIAVEGIQDPKAPANTVRVEIYFPAKIDAATFVIATVDDVEKRTLQLAGTMGLGWPPPR